MLGGRAQEDGGRCGDEGAAKVRSYGIYSGGIRSDKWEADDGVEMTSAEGDN
jgi:hypothetical protein